MVVKWSIVIILVFYIRLSASIRCYDCNSLNNTMCLDPNSYDEHTLNKYLPTVKCGDGVFTANHQGFFCRKIVQSILKKGYEPEVRVLRSCGWVRHQKDCYKADNEDHLETACQCFADGCNAAENVIAKLSLIVAALGIIGTRYNF